MVGRSTHHCICTFKHLVKHLAIIVVALCLGILVKNMFRILPVNITKANYVLCFHGTEVSGTTSSDTNTEDIQFVTW